MAPYRESVSRLSLPSPERNPRASSSSHSRMGLRGESVAEKATLEANVDIDREVLRCSICGLVQYRTKTDNCRRCLRMLPPKVSFVIPTAAAQDLPGDDRQLGVMVGPYSWQ